MSGVAPSKPTSAGAARRRFRPRFTLAALLALITLLAIPLAYIAQRRAWNLRRAKTIEYLRDKKLQLSFRTRTWGSIPRQSNSPFQRWWRKLTLDGSTGSLWQVASLTIRRQIGGWPPSELRDLITDDDLRRLSDFPELERIHFYAENQITDAGMSALARLPNVKTLYLDRVPRCQGRFLESLPADSPLEHLGFNEIDDLSGELLQSLKRLKRLAELGLSNCPKLTDSSLREANLPASLKVLNLSKTGIGDETLQRWLGQVELEELNLDARIIRALAPALARQANLRLLCITNAPLEDEDLEFLAAAKNLSDLSLTGMPLRGEFLKKLAPAANLTRLNLSETLLADENALGLSDFTALKSLELRFTPLTGECFTKGPRWSQLKELNLQGTEFSEPAKTALLKYAGAEKLFLPLNWDWRDYRRLPDDRLPAGWCLSSHALGAANLSHVTCDPKDAIGPIDRTPPELMAPVRRLHELAKEMARKH